MNAAAAAKLSMHRAWRGRIARVFGLGSIVAACLALLIAAPLANTRVCDGDTQAAYCQPRDKAKEKTRPRAPKQSADAQQRALLKSAVGRLAPQRDGVTDLYTIGVAGWADQDVFVRELNGTIASLSKTLPVAGRVLRLVNQPGPKREAPVATRDTIAAAIRSVSELMAKDEDVLILFMTSHGTRGGFVLQLPGRPLVEFAPRALARMLDGAGIRNRVVVVSACYSGAFVPPLANDNTIVITAADARSPSFGCAPGRDWTFFGDAFFNRSLRPGVDLQRAFDGARLIISEWESAENLSPSNPQAHFGPAVVEKLVPMFAGTRAKR
jgi:Peptidase C13 family